MGNQSIRQSLNDHEYKGRDFVVDETLKDGPKNERKCTDVAFLGLFLFSFFVYLITVRYAYVNGKPAELFSPVDGDGRLCGMNGLEAYPYLYYVVTQKDMMQPKAVCVKKCPKNIEDQVACYPTTKMSDVQVCVNENSKDGFGHVGYGTNRVLKRLCFPDGDKLPAIFDSKAYDKLVSEFGIDSIEDYLEYLEDMWGASNLVVYTSVTCILIFFAYSFFIYHFTGLLILVSIALVLLGIFFLVLKLQQYQEIKYGPDELHNQGAKFIYFLEFCTVALFILLACLYKDIKVSIAVLKTAGDVIVRNFMILFVPLVSTLINIAWTSLWLTNFGYLLSCGEISQPKQGSQLKHIELTDG